MRKIYAINIALACVCAPTWLFAQAPPLHGGAPDMRLSGGAGNVGLSGGRGSLGLSGGSGSVGLSGGPGGARLSGGNSLIGSAMLPGPLLPFDARLTPLPGPLPPISGGLTPLPGSTPGLTPSRPGLSSQGRP